MAISQEDTQGNVLPLNNILSWVETEIELNSFWYTTLTFQVLVSFSVDYIKLYWKTSEAWTYQLINLVESWIIVENITVADIYTVPVQWMVKLKFVRTWVADWPRTINWSLSTEWRN